MASDADGYWYFGGDLRNAQDVERILQELADDPAWASDVSRDAEAVLATFEEAVTHSSYTGRAGTFFAYEGLGSVYWHMVSKYLNAILGALDAAAEDPEAAAEAEVLAAAAHEVRAGLLVSVGPEQAGAIPIDPYSHTPAGNGARQPGMTGQVKEDIVIRWRDLGLSCRAGAVRFDPERVDPREWLSSDVAWRIPARENADGGLLVPAGGLGLTWCGTPVIYSPGGHNRRIIVHWRDGRLQVVPGQELPVSIVREIIHRSGEVAQLTVSYPADPERG